MAEKRKAGGGHSNIVDSPANKKIRTDGGYKIYVGRLNPTTSVQSVKKVFGVFGKIVDIYVPKKKTSSLSKGYCFITFQNESSMEDALKHDHIVVCGRISIYSNLAYFFVK